ncbi:MAG TPA: RNA degradosome polyphosphate kinase, partial [Ktedonobacterales bacterium]
AHKRGGQGRLIFKTNALVDPEIIRALYRASHAGVAVDLIIRGICCLRPGIPGVSEHIQVRSIVGRFLEHSRVYYFANGGAGAEVLLGSADLMERNLDHRIEVLFPLDDARLRDYLATTVLPAYLRDTVNTRILQADGRYERVQVVKGEPAFDVQQWMASAEAAVPVRLQV